MHAAMPSETASLHVRSSHGRRPLVIVSSHGGSRKVGQARERRDDSERQDDEPSRPNFHCRGHGILRNRARYCSHVVSLNGST